MKGVCVAGLVIPRRTKEERMLWDLCAEQFEKRLPRGLYVVWPTVWVYRVMPERN